MAKTPLFDSINVGDSITPLVKGPMTTAHIMRWSSAIENWHRIHYDRTYAQEHDKLPDVMVNGSWKQHVLIQLVSDWAGEDGWVVEIDFQFRGMDVPGNTLTAFGTVTETRDCGAYGLVMLEIGLKNETGQNGTPGTASVLLPKAGGPPVPYPLDPAILAGAES
ncbi:hypothetical protein ATO13_08311 [Stappia sp. 22II-S9-Z10]|nr:hypothetical protein ATO13_08311 [Stappia sp. 22II-S9-Z10]